MGTVNVVTDHLLAELDRLSRCEGDELEAEAKSGASSDNETAATSEESGTRGATAATNGSGRASDDGVAAGEVSHNGIGDDTRSNDDEAEGEDAPSGPAHSARNRDDRA